MTTISKETSTAAILAAWLLVGIPAAWGVYNTALNAKKLFTSPAAVAAPATPAFR